MPSLGILIDMKRWLIRKLKNLNYQAYKKSIGSLKKRIPLNGHQQCQHLQFLRKTEAEKLRVVTDFMKLNLLLKRRVSPFSIPKIADMIHSMEGFACFIIGIKNEALSHQTRC
jgi:hypothetical protein